MAGFDSRRSSSTRGAVAGRSLSGTATVAPDSQERRRACRSRRYPDAPSHPSRSVAESPEVRAHPMRPITTAALSVHGPGHRRVGGGARRGQHHAQVPPQRGRPSADQMPGSQVACDMALDVETWRQWGVNPAGVKNVLVRCRAASRAVQPSRTRLTPASLGGATSGRCARPLPTLIQGSNLPS